MLETYRECLQDVFDLPALRGILKGIQTRELDLVEVETATASPFASSLLFDYVATYMYEDDTPAEERRAQALSLDRGLLRELMGVEELRELLDVGAIEQVAASLRPTPRNADELHDLLRRAGPLFDGEYDAGFAETLLRERRAIRVRLGDVEPLAAVEDAGLVRDALGAVPPGGVPQVFLEPVDDALGVVFRRYARTSGPFTTAEAAARFGIELGWRKAGSSRSSVTRSSFAESFGQAAPSASGATPTSCAAFAARRSPCCAARSSPPTRPRSAGSCPRGTGSGGASRCARRWFRCRGSRCRSRSGRATCCRGACPGTGRRISTRCAPRATSSGSAPGSIASRCTSATTPRCSVHRPPRRRPRATRTRRFARRSAGCALLGRPLAATELEPADALSALWDLVWAGEVTNDSWAPLRASRRYEAPRPERGRRRFARSRTSAPSPTQGRWSLAAPLFPERLDRRALAELLLERQGIVTRDGVRGEGIRGGYGAVYGELRALETLGVCRRGYFVEGLGGAQFALPGAVERLRELRADAAGAVGEREALVLAAADPAQPYGAAVPWPRRAGARAARVAGAWVVLLDGEAALFVERGGRSLVPLREPDPEWLRPALAALVAHVRSGGAKRLAVERFDGAPVVETEAMELLVESGFLAGPRRAVLRS